MPSGMLNIEEVKQYLEVDEDYIDKLIASEKLDAYKIGGQYLRFEKEQVIALKELIASEEALEKELVKNINNFWNVNSFYIITTIVLVLILYFILT